MRAVVVPALRAAEELGIDLSGARAERAEIPSEEDDLLRAAEELGIDLSGARAEAVDGEEGEAGKEGGDEDEAAEETKAEESA